MKVLYSVKISLILDHLVRFYEAFYPFPQFSYVIFVSFFCLRDFQG